MTKGSDTDTLAATVRDGLGPLHAASSRKKKEAHDALAALVEHARTLERERGEAREKDGLVGSAGSDRDPDTSGASPEGNDGGQALPTSLADALEDLADARAATEAVRAMRDRHEERYEKHKARADRYEKAIRHVISDSAGTPDSVKRYLRGKLYEDGAALAGEDT